MRKLLFVAMAFMVFCTIGFFTVGCTDKKPAEVQKNDSVPEDTLQVNNEDEMITEEVKAPDTVKASALDEIIASTPMPKAADELFDDFIFNFMANKKLQLERVEFPLTVITNGKTEKKNQGQWTQEHFWHNDVYTIILDNLNQLKAAKDTSVNHVVIEKLFVDRNEAQQFEFNRVEGQWKMTCLKKDPFESNKNASFLKFYQQFATDSLFQTQNMGEPVAYYGPDPEDETNNINGTLPDVIWESFANELPSGVIYNVIYGDDTKNSTQKILVMREPASSLEAQLTFTLKGGQWKLTKVSL